MKTITDEADKFGVVANLEAPRGRADPSVSSCSRAAGGAEQALVAALAEGSRPYSSKLGTSPVGGELPFALRASSPTETMQYGAAYGERSGGISRAPGCRRWVSAPA
jgi:hypothetical protein